MNEGDDVMSDRFFTQKLCDRCHKELSAGRTMSMFNEQCICLECAEKEREDPEYKKAEEADQVEIRKGNYNFKGIRS